VNIRLGQAHHAGVMAFDEKPECRLVSRPERGHNLALVLLCGRLLATSWFARFGANLSRARIKHGACTSAPHYQSASARALQILPSMLQLCSYLQPCLSEIDAEVRVDAVEVSSSASLASAGGVTFTRVVEETPTQSKAAAPKVPAKAGLCPQDVGSAGA